MKISPAIPGMKARRRGLTLSTGLALAAHAALGQPAHAPTVRAGTSGPLVWDASSKEAIVLYGRKAVSFAFDVTNTAPRDVIIYSVKTSCGCTVAKLPSDPWLLPPYSGGQLGVTVHLGPVLGTFSKSIAVYALDLPAKDLTVKITVKETGTEARKRNRMIATGDRQAVFAGACAKCHCEPARGTAGADLYAALCGICHDARRRAVMVPDLRSSRPPRSRSAWRAAIATGLPGTLMPAFSNSHGGPLTEAQVDSLARDLAGGLLARTQITHAADNGTTSARPSLRGTGGAPPGPRDSARSSTN